MTKITKEVINERSRRADLFLNPHGLTRDKAITGRDAWTIAARTDMTHDAYKDRDVTDGHIQTALAKVFPNAVFQDKKVY